MRVIGLTGTNGAGKGTVVEYLIRNGFRHFSVGGFLKKEIIKRGLPVNRDSMTEVANDLRQEFGPGYIVEQLFLKAKECGENCVIESIRTVGEIESLKRMSDFVLAAVDADPKIRYERISLRKSEKDNVTYEKFLSDEERETENSEPFKQNLKKCIEMADVKLRNDTSKVDLYRQVDELLLSGAKSDERKD
jgi:dephospho-CoA kinase